MRGGGGSSVRQLIQDLRFLIKSCNQDCYGLVESAKGQFMIEVIGEQKFISKVFDYKTKQEWSFSGDRPVIVNFFATWCGPCKMFTPTLEEIAQNYSGKVEVFKVDIDATPEIPALFGIRSVPTTLFVAPGEDPALAQGLMNKEAVEQAISELFKIAHN